MAGRFVHVAQPYARVEGGGDERVAQGLLPDGFVDPRRADRNVQARTVRGGERLVA